ncbi:C2 domain [Phytophthora infestans]|uniref:C2 domain n=1 Tax=Phytophthora infestans TaxID=4787 RepID=A0A833SRK6_PHYIN|nr:C2 domain [Phytophthora infestans]KAF4140419.1 C2 domain [Phytophthora infestans]
MLRSRSASMSKSSDVDDFEDAPVEILPQEIRLAEDADDTLPNTLVITVLQARHLQPSAFRDTLSCYVKLSSLGVEYKTSVMTKTREPRWHEVFAFRAVDWTTGVTVSVRDRLPINMHFIGQVVISSAEIASLPGMTTQRWFQLRDKGVAGQLTGAELELKVALVYTKANDQELFQAGSAAAELEHGAVDAGLADLLVGQEDETEEEADARTRALVRREEQEREAAAVIASLKQGDYQVQVHVIEARDLKGENLSGTSDPYCQVDIMGVSKKTSTKYDTLGCVFDEVLFFNFTNIGRHELREASIKISVYDKERVLRDNLIGIYQLDCLSVYTQPHHELYRQWIAVHDNLSAKDRGIQGFLLVSVVLLGPGDALRVHDREAEVEQELAETTGEKLPEDRDQPTTITPLVLVPPAIELKLQFLVVRVLRAEHLPAMDTGGLLIGAQGIDAFVKVVFAANAPCKTSVVTVKGRGNLAPDFYEELWLPVRIPTFSRHIGISIWDRDLTSPNELVGVASQDFLQVPAEIMANLTSLKSPDSPRKTKFMFGNSDDEYFEEELSETTTLEKMELEEEQQRLQAAAPRWYNLYGPPLRGTNPKRKQLVSRHAELGSTYRGRVLLSTVRVESPRPEDGEKMHTKPMSAEERERLERSIPKTVKYTLRGALYCGVELPRSSSSALMGGASHVRVTLSLGPYTNTFESQEVAKDGTATFEQCAEHGSALELPADLTQIPDIIVTLSRSVGVASRKEEFVSVSFARIRAEKLFASGFTGKCQWVVLREEIARRQTRHALERTQNPGVLLLRLGFGRVEMATKHPWATDGDSTEFFAPFRFPRVHREICVHIFQARGLESPAHVARVPSPGVIVRCCGQQKRTKACQNTPAPLFYESLVFLASVPASDVVYTPEIVVQVQDTNGNAAGVLGELRLSLASAVRSVATAGSPKPRWYELKKPRSRSSTSVSLLLAEQAGGSAGQLLVAIQYIDHTGSDPPGILRSPAAITPKFVEANLDIVALGVRHLKALNTLGVRRPHVEFELVGGYFVDGSSVKRTQSATGSSSKNANFLDRIVAHVKLPVDTLYAPQLQIRVCDTTLGGLRKTTLASCIVDLADKLPWSPTYRVEIAEGSGSPFRSPSKRKQREKDVKSGAENEESETEFLFDEGQPEEETEYPLDDGTGVGDLVLPSVLQSHARVSSIYTLEDTDPALIEQRRREEERRYNASKAALLLSHRPSNDRRGSVLGSPRSSSRDQEQHRAPYLPGRDWWISQYGGEELEKYFSSPALETYQLHRPVLSRPSLLSFERVKVQLRAGVFKGRITVMERRAKSESRSQEEERAKQEHLELQRLQDGPQRVVVRVYVLRGQNLQAKNANGYSDPYLRLKLGSNRINDRSNACINTLKPEFFRMFEVETTLPGASQLDINVWDRGLVSDQLIGSTTIDLEERWFHREWQEIGAANASEKRLKPIEYRHLYVPQNRTTSQGFLQLWVDILATQEAARIDPVDISLPAPKTFEVRVVVWRAENVQDQSQSEINDYFVKAWMESWGVSGSSRAESTDTHWRCSNGKPCWNWRLVMKTEFPPRSPELARLHVQLWDKDVLKWNDVLGEAQLDLYKWLRRAYETNRSVAPFLELKRLARQSIIPGEIPDTSRDATEGGNTSESFDSSEDEKDVAVTLSPREDNALLGEKPKKQSRKRIQKRREPTLAERKQQKDEADAEAALNGLLDFMGLGRLPDDAEWIPIYFTDREAAVSMEMGRIGISVLIVPEEEALASPVGKGQNAPNLNPYLPPPVGRMRFTANPIAMLKVLVGPRMCIRLSVMCCCVGCMLFISVFGATVMSTLTYLQAMEARHSQDKTV